MSRNHRLIMGKNCISEVLRNFPDRIQEVYTLDSASRDPLYRELESKGVRLKHRNKKELEELVNSTSHQNFIAAVKSGNSCDLKEILEEAAARESSLVLMLDSIFDPHNFGAILRAAECLGVDCVVYSKNRGADVTPVVSKVSSGASELVPLLKVSNLAETAKRFQKEGFEAVVADVGEGSQSLEKFSFPDKTLLILGSEGEGVQQLLRKRSDWIVRIPMLGKIDSLNVSQAAAVFLSAYRFR